MPEGEIFLSYSDRLMMDFFFLFQLFQGFSLEHETSKKHEHCYIYIISRVFLLGVVMGIHIVCTLLLTAKYTIGALAKLPNAK